MHDYERVTICLVGPFRVVGPAGEDLTPRGQKSRGLLAILALSPQFQRPRITLQDKLWSDRGPEQASASLRQALAEVRRSLAAYRDCLVADHRAVGLRPEAVTVDADLPVNLISKAAFEPILLEGLDVRDPEFEDWLREQRSAFESRVRQERSQVADVRPVTGTEPPQSPRAPPAQPGILSIVQNRPWICIPRRTDLSASDDSLIAGILASAIASGMQELGAVDITTSVRDSPGIELSVDARMVAAGAVVRIALLEPHEGRVLWSGDQVLPRDRDLPVEEGAIRAVVNQVVDIALIQLRRLMSGADASSSFALGFDAIQRMFRVDAGELHKADASLIAAYDQDPRGIFLAWRAYLRTFFAAEHRQDFAAQAEEARMLARKALEHDPFNSYVLALCSYVHSLLLFEYQAGLELATQSIRYNPGNPLGLAYLGRAKSYLGDFEGGYQLTAKAQSLAGPSPYRYTLDFLGGVNATLAGRFEEAIRMEEVSSSLGPAYKAPLRYLLALYLKTGDRDRARLVLEKLRRTEPELSMRLMRDPAYPVEGLRIAGLLNHYDEEFE